MAKKVENKKSDEKVLTLSSGVEVVILPFPLGLLDRINKEHPDPIPPKKTITVLGGTEEIDDENNPEYQEAKRVNDNRRNTKLGEATVEFCVECDLSKYEGAIKRLEKFTEPYPTDPDERRSRFLTEYALRTVNDYSLVIMSSINQSTVTDAEVQERVRSFQGDLPGHTTNGTPSPGAQEIIGVDVVEPS